MVRENVGLVNKLKQNIGRISVSSGSGGTFGKVLLEVKDKGEETFSRIGRLSYSYNNLT